MKGHSQKNPNLPKLIQEKKNGMNAGKEDRPVIYLVSYASLLKQSPYLTYFENTNNGRGHDILFLIQRESAFKRLEVTDIYAIKTIYNEHFYEADKNIRCYVGLQYLRYHIYMHEGQMTEQKDALDHVRDTTWH